jgi:lysophospholipase L1-like esterase
LSAARAAAGGHDAPVRRTTVVALAALGALVVAAVLLRDRGGEARTGSLTTVGDSLNVGVAPYLGDALPGWEIAGDDVVGRGSSDGIQALERLRPSLAPVVVVSLGTNDPQADADGFREHVREVLRLAGDGRCVIWSTVWRGGPNEAFNQVLADEARDNRALRLVDWHAMVAAHREWLAGDGVHGTPEGYAARAAAIAEVATRCLPSGSA